MLVLLGMLGDKNLEIGGTLLQSISSCLATLEFFLLQRQRHPVLSSMVIADKHKSANNDDKIGPVEAIANILGISDINSINPNDNFGDVGMDSLMATEIKQTLERNYDIILSPQEIRVLTIAKLQELSLTNAKTTKPASETENLNNTLLDDAANNLMIQWPSNELLPKEVLVRLKTKSAKGPALFIVHAVEGLTNAFEFLASEMKRPVWGLQSAGDAPHDTISELAEFYVKTIKKVQKEGPYHVAGYSFGGCVAFEMALQLECIGETVILTLLDGSPEYVLRQTEMIGRIDLAENLTSDSCMKALAYFSIQFNKDLTLTKVSIREYTVYLYLYFLSLFSYT